MKLAFITDIHFGRLTAGAVEALLADLRTQQPDLILIGGDVTQRGLAKQYRECQKFLSTLPAPWLCVIGNHDVPAWNLFQRFTNPYGPYQKFITRDLNPTWVNETIAIQGLNSARRFPHNGAWEQGEISDWQIDLAMKFFAQYPGKTKILVVHHPLMQTPQQESKMLVHNHAHALNTLAATGVDIICTGHLHRASVESVQSKIQVAHKPLWNVMGGTATCDRLRGEANSYWIIEIGAMPRFALRIFNGISFGLVEEQKS